MCEANAYLVKDGKEELVMESVDIVRLECPCLFRRLHREFLVLMLLALQPIDANHRISGYDPGSGGYRL